MKIVVLSTFGDTFGKTLVSNLLKHNYEVTLVMERPDFKTRIRQVFRYIKNKGFVKTLEIIKNFVVSKIETTNRSKSEDSQLAQIETYYVEDLNSEKNCNLMKKLNLDLVILGGTRIIKDYILKIPKKGTINCHPGLLPRFRGLDVVSWAILSKEKVGATVHYVNEGVDSGDIIIKKEITTNDCDNLSEIREKVKKLSYGLILKSVRLIERRKVKRIKQKERYKLYTKMPKKLLIKVEDIIKNEYKNKH